MIDYIYNKRKLIMAISLALWLAVQVFLVIKYWNQPQYSDASVYMEYAIQCYKEGQWYPDFEQVNNHSYLFNPGFVNFLILELKAFGSFTYHGLIGMLLNVLLLASVRRIVKKLINSEASDYATILYCLMYSNMAVSVLVMSDLFFACLLFGSFLLLYPKYISLVLSSMLMCYANYTRPLFVIFAISILLYMYMKDFGWKRICIYCISYLIMSYGLSLLVSNNTAARNSSGSTLGVNLIMGANNHMNGTYNDEVFQKGNIGYVSKKIDVYQKDSLWRTNAISWIALHPIKYISYVPIKIIRLWWGDYYMDLPLNNMIKSQTLSYSKWEFYKRCMKIIFYSLFYYVSFFFMIVALWRLRKKLWGYWGVFLLPVILACGMHGILYGGMRYHYPYVPIVILYATIGLMSFKDKKLSFLNKINVK